MNKLSTLRILVTRPSAQGKILCEKIEAMGGRSLYFPTIECVPIEAHLPQRIDHYDWMIFVSREAVLQSMSLILQRSNKTRIAALGEGTASALHERGIVDVIYPTQEWTSEGLLDLSYFKTVNQQTILLVRGEGGRELLTETLTKRGAKVDHLLVYRRVMPVYADDHPVIALLSQKKIDIIVCTSGESLHNLITIMGEKNRSLLMETTMLVVSKRLFELAKQSHFQRIFQANNASHAAIIDTLCFIKGKSYVR